MTLGASASTGAEVEALSRTNRLRILELRNGLRIETRSWVGRVELGGLSVTIAPKLEGLPLLRLLRYAYGLRDLELHADARYMTGKVALDDLLIRQLRSISLPSTQRVGGLVARLRSSTRR